MGGVQWVKFLFFRRNSIVKEKGFCPPFLSPKKYVIDKQKLILPSTKKKTKKKLGGIKTSCFWLADDSIKCEGFNSQMPLFSRYKGLWTEVHFFLQTDTKNKDHVLHTQKLTLSSIKYFQKTKPFPNCKKNITLKVVFWVVSCLSSAVHS